MLDVKNENKTQVITFNNDNTKTTTTTKGYEKGNSKPHYDCCSNICVQYIYVDRYIDYK